MTDINYTPVEEDRYIEMRSHLVTAVRAGFDAKLAAEQEKVAANLLKGYRLDWSACGTLAEVQAQAQLWSQYDNILAKGLEDGRFDDDVSAPFEAFSVLVEELKKQLIGNYGSSTSTDQFSNGFSDAERTIKSRFAQWMIH
jgi:hypothetical protein